MSGIMSRVPHASSEQVQMREMLDGLMSSDHKEKDSYPECSSAFTEVMEWFKQHNWYSETLWVR